MTVPAVSGNTLADIIIWVRRILKSPSTQSISDAVIADYVNRFYLYDVPARIQLLELKRQYTFETVPNIFEYQAPFIGSSRMPQYHIFQPPVYADGVQMGWYQSNDQFYKVFPELVQNEFPLQGNGTLGPYNVNFGRSPILRGFIDDLGNLEPYVFITALDATLDQNYIVDSGFLNTTGQGVLINTDASFQVNTGIALTFNGAGRVTSGGCGTVDYILGTCTFSFLNAIPGGNNIGTQTSPYSSGFPRCCLFYNNIFKLYPVPDRAYKIQCDAYITPAQFFAYGNVENNSFSYMYEYLARGAAQKILSDTGDMQQFQFYEPIFRQQENFVLRRSDRQRANMRTPTIFSTQSSQNPYIFTQY